ncbi:cation:proton antiporter domain-containing protein [Massilia scottii]|uniref:cation:proton antiporter domain-containing protein n=1 Tax=Massilia scottii TaxID=3057166 RepID=UPI0027969A9B|nr:MULTISPECIES: cation:proton antiporter [unclassified Massilia]MDQ1812022.1 cation:proton antiporter [Massilia sp. CCM 9210]MDQ1833738.1 cation:proton antiporter [Massilia sp. CCM 9029]
MNEDVSTLPLWLLSPLAVVGAGLLLSQVIGVLMQSRGWPKLYGAVIAGLILGVSGLGLVDAALLSQFQELFNAASALVLFEVGRKMDLAWLWRSARQGGSLVLGCVLRGMGAWAVLAAFGLGWGEAAFIAAILIAVNPVVFTSMVSDSHASGVATYAAANTVGISNLVALLALSGSLAWMRSHGINAEFGFSGELLRQGSQLALGAAIALLCYGLYTIATRISKAQAGLRPGILLAALMMDLGLCSVSSASALLSLLLMGLLLRNAETRDNVFQAQVKTAQDIGYALLFMMSAALVQLQHLFQWMPLLAALLVFAVRVGLTRLALMPSGAWSRDKKHAIALSLCSLVSFGSLVVDNSMSGAAYMSEAAASIMAALLALNVLVGPGLTWWGLKLADETHEGDEHG